MKKSLQEKYPLLVKSLNNKLDLEAQYKKAWQGARLAADLLKKEYGAKQVWVFGSLTDQSKFDHNSDIDLAEIGVPDHKFYAAVAAVTRAIRDFKVDLVDKENCRDVLKKSIEEEGIEV